MRATLGFAVDFDQHSIVNFIPKRFPDGRQVGPESVRGELHTHCKALAKVLDEGVGCIRIPAIYPVRNDQLGIRINRGPGPNITKAELPLEFSGDIGFLGIAERPNLITLNPLAGQVAEVLVVVFGARSARYPPRA